MAVTVELVRWAVGGEAVGRLPDGRTVFVAGALPGERTEVEVVEERPRFARARLLTVAEASPERVEPTCPEVARGCGGCDLAHVSAAEQRRAKSTMVTDALLRLGRVEAPEPAWGAPLADRGFRATLRGVVDPGSGRAGQRRRGSHDQVAVAACAVAHPSVAELLVEGRYEGSAQVRIRVGLRTGQRMVSVDGPVTGVSVPPDVVVAGALDGALDDGTSDGAAERSSASIEEEVAGRRFRISDRSFFQTRPDGADQLVALVAGAATADGAVPRLVDLCGGVGLFAATVPADEVTLVETSRSAVADARHNLADHPGRVELVRAAMERWRPAAADVVVADPPRTGLGRGVVERIAATGATRVVLVSCDAGSLGRDAGLLAGHGFRPDTVTLVDLFPDTAHVEVVSSWARS